MLAVNQLTQSAWFHVEPTSLSDLGALSNGSPRAVSGNTTPRRGWKAHPRSFPYRDYPPQATTREN